MAVPEHLYTLEQKRAWLPDRSRLQEKLRSGETLVAAEAARVLGYMVLRADGDLDMAYVAPDHQRRGVGQLLLRSVLARAEELRLGRVFTRASHAAKPLFERGSFGVVRENRVLRAGQELTNWIMAYRLVDIETPRRIFIVGNSGSGKSTLSRALCHATVEGPTSLDAFAFSDQVGTRRPVPESLARLEAASVGRVIEGCYADLISAMAQPEDHLVWLDLPVSVCQSHAAQRPWEPDKWPDAASQDAFLPRLLDFIATYPEAAGPTGRPAHAALFDAFSGTREVHREPVDALSP